VLSQAPSAARKRLADGRHAPSPTLRLAPYLRHDSDADLAIVAAYFRAVGDDSKQRQADWWPLCICVALPLALVVVWWFHRARILQGMRVVVGVDGDDDLAGSLESWLRDSPELTDVQISQGRGEVRPGELGAVEVLTFVATNVALPLILTAVYDFFARRRRSRPAERARVVVTRTDLPGGARQVQLEFEGPAGEIEGVVRDLGGGSGSGEG
jgi:hypothetical protein